jgi:Na+-driven multidrug efflux pump
MELSSRDLAKKDVRSLLLKQSVPASIGILFMTVNILIDTIFVGRWIGSLAIAALSVVTPITFFISSMGMAIGTGGGSVLSRALGAKDREKALNTFAHQIMMTLGISSVFVALGLFFRDEILYVFGANGAILKPAQEFFFPILLAVPFQALCMMGNNVIRAEDKSRHSMISMIISAISNLILDIVFIKILGWGVFGAALATATSFFLCFAYIFWFFVYRSELRLRWEHFSWKNKIAGEITSLSFVTFARQGVISILAILLNHTLFAQGGEHAVTVSVAIKYATGLAILIFIVILIFARPITAVFTTDADVIRDTPKALRWVFAASPIIAIQLIGAAYFQAAGKATRALLLTLSKQGFFLIPLVLILPQFFGIFGVWVAFPIADILSTIVTGIFLKKEMAEHANDK